MLRLMRLNGSPGPVAVLGWAGPALVGRGCRGGGGGGSTPQPGWVSEVKTYQNPGFRWAPVCQNMTMPRPETEFYGVKQHFGVARRCRPAPGRLGFAPEALSGQPWARS